MTSQGWTPYWGQQLSCTDLLSDFYIILITFLIEFIKSETICNSKSTLLLQTVIPSIKLQAYEAWKIILFK